MDETARRLALRRGKSSNLDRRCIQATAIVVTHFVLRFSFAHIFSRLVWFFALKFDRISKELLPQQDHDQGVYRVSKICRKCKARVLPLRRKGETTVHSTALAGGINPAETGVV